MFLQTFSISYTRNQIYQTTNIHFHFYILLRRFLATLGLVIFHNCLLNTVQSNVPTLIWPLGDIFTHGGSIKGGYRTKLYQLLNNKFGYTVDFLGSQATNPNVLLPDWDHEGHSSLTIQMLIYRISEYLDRLSALPDLILLNIGLEDLKIEKNIDIITESYQELILKISDIAVTSHIIASTILDDTTFNQRLEQLVHDLSLFNGIKISFVDIWSYLSENDYIIEGGKRTLQLNQKGYDRAAVAWSHAIKNSGITPLGNEDVPILLKVQGLNDLMSMKLIFSKPISDYSVNNLDNFVIMNKNILITGAILQPCKRITILTTSIQNPGIKYTITVKNIQDRRNYSPLNRTMLDTTVTFIPGWRFINLSDWHNGEKYALPHIQAEWKVKQYKNDVRNLKIIKETYGGEFILIAGDTQVGFWDSKEFRNSLDQTLTHKESIIRGGNNCFKGMLISYRDAGYWKVIAAFGDHEAGDNPWPKDTVKSTFQFEFRHTFGQNFNYDMLSGQFLYLESIGNVPSRPFGTIFEHTSYAYIHRNMLLLTVDCWYQESPSRDLNEFGTVDGRVDGDHLEWFKSILESAQTIKEIKHIIVQAHLPILVPVRKVLSSGMVMSNDEKNAFWKVMQKYGVDIFFCGEVHLHTVTKDFQSDLVQIASRGNYFTSFLTIDVTDTTIDITSYNERGNKSRGYNYNYEPSGRFLIIKNKDGTKTYQDSGELRFLDRSKPMMYFSFQYIVPLKKRPINGLHQKGRVNAIEIEVWNVSCKYSLPNLGAFGQDYDAQVANIELIKGVHGKGGVFTEDSRAAVYGMGPHSQGRIISYSLWISTKSPVNMVLISYMGYWPQENYLNLHIRRDGRPIISYGKKNRLIGANGVRLNYGYWHHIAMTMPRENCFLSQIYLYVDGKKVDTHIHGQDNEIHLTNSGVLALGGYGHAENVQTGFFPFLGKIDEVYVWTRSLSSKEVEHLSKRDDCEVVVRISSCNVLDTGTNCGDISLTPNSCDDLYISYELQICNAKHFDLVNILSAHFIANGEDIDLLNGKITLQLEGDTCFKKKIVQNINVCNGDILWVNLRVIAGSDIDILCDDFTFMRTILTTSPSTSELTNLPLSIPIINNSS